MSDRCMRCNVEIDLNDNNFHNVTPDWAHANYVHLQCEYVDLLNYIDALRQKLRLAEAVCVANIALRDFQAKDVDVGWQKEFFAVVGSKDRALAAWEAQQPHVNDFED